MQRICSEVNQPPFVAGQAQFLFEIHKLIRILTDCSEADLAYVVGSHNMIFFTFNLEEQVECVVQE